jgi:flavin reductase (DIM6/NTAB) family NADH-FMN oxidoreductase RutF
VAPPVLQFTSVGVKDSLRNVRETGEFVVHVVSRALAETANGTSTNFPPELGEFEALSLPTAPSHLVAAPRLAAAGVSVECRSAGERVFGNSVVVFGEIVWITVEDGLLAQDGLVDVAALAPVSRLGRNDWAEVGPRFTLAREPYDHWRSRQ